MSNAAHDAATSPDQILHEAQNLALLAVCLDQQKDVQAAIYYYSVMSPFDCVKHCCTHTLLFLTQESIVYLKRYLAALEGGNGGNGGGDTPANVEKKLADYERRLRELQVKLSESKRTRNLWNNN